MQNNLSFQRRVNRRLNDHSWNGFFIDKNDNNKVYDPMHICISWGKCCSENVLLKPSHLLKLEKIKDSYQNIIRKKQINEQIKILKPI